MASSVIPPVLPATKEVWACFVRLPANPAGSTGTAGTREWEKLLSPSRERTLRHNSSSLVAASQRLGSPRCTIIFGQGRSGSLSMARRSTRGEYDQLLPGICFNDILIQGWQLLDVRLPMDFKRLSVAG